MTDVYGVPVPMPPRFVVCSGLPERMVVCCPVCGCDHIHPERVTVDQGNARSIVIRDSTAVVAAKPQRRGSVVVLRFWCEHGHGFEYQYEFGKGQVACELLWWRLPVGQTPSELWRD